MLEKERLNQYVPNGTRKLIALRGLPASGKSTLALAAIKAHPGAVVRINNDDIATSIFGKSFLPELKNSAHILRNLRFKIISELINDSQIEIIIVDNTNITDSAIKDLAKIAADNGLAFIIDDSFLSVSLQDCLVRDAARELPVGEAVIRGMHHKLNITRNN